MVIDDFVTNNKILKSRFLKSNMAAKNKKWQQFFMIFLEIAVTASCVHKLTIPNIRIKVYPYIKFKMSKIRSQI